MNKQPILSIVAVNGNEITIRVDNGRGKPFNMVRTVINADSLTIQQTGNLKGSEHGLEFIVNK